MEHSSSDQIRSFYYRLLVLGGCVLASVWTYGQTSISLSSSARISVLTTSPGREDLYTLFGHAAFRIEDPAHHIDEVYGYGAFDFNTPNFYPNFVRGTLLYSMTLDRFDTFLLDFKSEPYEMTQQILHLDSVQVHHLYALLRNNYLPQNRLYAYDFFYDNCATRIRELLVQATSDPELISRQLLPNAPTFRDLLRNYLVERPWVQLGTDLILGMPADRKLSPYDQCFLPFYLAQTLREARLPTRTPLVGQTISLLSRGKMLFRAPFLSPSGILWIVVILSLPILLAPKWRMPYCKILWALSGTLGLLILYLWLGTQRTSYGLNLNMLWASPLYFFLFLLRPRSRKILALLGLFELSLLFVFMAFRVQGFNPAIIPIGVLLGISLVLETISEMPVKGSRKDQKALWQEAN